MIILNQEKEIFDYTDLNGFSVMHSWADEMPMQTRERAKLDQKIDLLKRTEDNLLPKLLHPTKCKHIMHLTVNGRVALRPMLCRGPANEKKEFTFLFGTTERDRKFVDRNAPQKAEDNRQNLELHPGRRCKHERFFENPERVVSK